MLRFLLSPLNDRRPFRRSSRIRQAGSSFFGEQNQDSEHAALLRSTVFMRKKGR